MKKSLFFQNITSDKSALKVYVISDFGCNSCINAETKLRKLYEKYYKRVNFRFVYFSDYIDKSAIACEAAARQGEFIRMHNKIFDNTEILNDDSIYFRFALDMGMDTDIFEEDMKDTEVLKKIMENKKYLLSKNIQSTPTFIVNNKILKRIYSIHYLEDVIIEDLNNQ